MVSQANFNQAKAAEFMRGTNLSALAHGMTFPVTWSFEKTGETINDYR